MSENELKQRPTKGEVVIVVLRAAVAVLALVRALIG